MRKAVLLRVGIDSGSGGIQGPLFKDGSFEYICIPDKKGVSRHKYGTCIGRNGLAHSEHQNTAHCSCRSGIGDAPFRTFGSCGKQPTSRPALRYCITGEDSLTKESLAQAVCRE